MENKEGYLEFISSESYKNQLDIWHKAYNISREKTELFHDFIISLYVLVEETFLGPDVLEDKENQKNHFTWCWDKIITDFTKEKIYFKVRGTHYEYFWNLFFEVYYTNQMEATPVRILEYFDLLFDFKHRKTRSELDMFVEFYKLLEQNLKK